MLTFFLVKFFFLALLKYQVLGFNKLYQNKCDHFMFLLGQILGKMHSELNLMRASKKNWKITCICSLARQGEGGGFTPVKKKLGSYQAVSEMFTVQIYFIFLSSVIFNIMAMELKPCSTSCSTYSVHSAQILEASSSIGFI